MNLPRPNEEPTYSPDDSLSRLDSLIIEGKCNPKLLTFLATKSLVFVSVVGDERRHIPGSGLNFSRLRQFEMDSYHALYGWFAEWLEKQAAREARLSRQARLIEPDRYRA